ncbi:MAG: NYN domain-containing protein [Bacillota bacterium]
MKELLIVDGYNIIFNWESLAEKAQEDMEWARLELIQILEDYAGFSGIDVLLVFDAYQNPGAERTRETKGPLTIVYTRSDETADQYIERCVQEHKDAQTDLRISVATSDGVQQSLVLGMGATRVPSRELRLMVEAAKGRQRGIIKTVQKRSAALENRVDKGVFDKLERIRRGTERD